MEVVYRRCCGIDVHKKSIAVCVSILKEGGLRQEHRTFATYTAALRETAAWLRQQQVTHVAMESTGVFWVPVWNVLEQELADRIASGDLELVLVNAQHVKAIPGYKTDRKDGKRLSELMMYNLLPRSFVPRAEIRDLRELVRCRTRKVQDVARLANRIQRLLEQGNIKLAAVASDVLGVSGRRMLQALAQGSTEPTALAELAVGVLRKKEESLRLALEGQLRPVHQLVLTQMLRELQAQEGQIAGLEAAIRTAVEPYAALLGIWRSIPGISEVASWTLLAELGPEMRQFPSAGDLASWAGLCPGNHESAGIQKRGTKPHGNIWIGRVLCQAAWAASRTKHSRFQAQLRRIAMRRGIKRALIAVAHTLLQLAYTLAIRGCRYVEGSDNEPTRRRQLARAVHLARELRALGHQVTLRPLAPETSG
jgi:transposase